MICIFPVSFHQHSKDVRRKLFCREGTGYIVQYDLVTEKVVSQATLNKNIQLLAYLCGGHNGIDLSVDENGLRALSGTAERFFIGGANPAPKVRGI